MGRREAEIMIMTNAIAYVMFGGDETKFDGTKIEVSGDNAQLAYRAANRAYDQLELFRKGE